MPAEEAATSDKHDKPKKQNGWRALLRARRRREKREKRQEMMINHKPSLFRWPTRALPAVAGCRTEPHKPCCVSCDQNVGSHLVLDLGARLLATRSAFQAIEVFDTEAFGHVMTIDGDLQITEMDECHYHEMMVHVPLASRKPGAGAPRVLIIGGGDGGCAREALRWPGSTVTLVDIDAAVLDAARRFFPACATGLDDPRTEVHVSDGAAFAAAAAVRGDTYDLVICDSTDCSAAERASGTLYTDAFLVSVAALVAPGGFFCRNYTSLLLCGNLNFTARSLNRRVDLHAIDATPARRRVHPTQVSSGIRMRRPRRCPATLLDSPTLVLSYGCSPRTRRAPTPRSSAAPPRRARRAISPPTPRPSARRTTGRPRFTRLRSRSPRSWRAA